MIALKPGERLGPYQIVGLVGSGGMGEVYRARDPRLRRDVALKVLHPSLATPEHVERLSREARATGALNHPNILAVFDVGIEGGLPYVVSELLEGESLRQRLDRGRLPYRKALDYAAHIAQALAAAHDKGICHRDVKPGNVFITSDGRVKLLDFGLAKLERAPVGTDDSTAPSLTGPGTRAGTAGYMAPEQVLGQVVDHRTDLFALGAVLYEMLSGARAFRGSSSEETLTAVLRDDPADLRELNPGLPAAVTHLVRRCLEKSREERFQSARDLAFQLQQLHDATLAPAPSPRRRVVRARVLVAAVALAALAGAAVAVRTATSRRAIPSFEQLTFHRGRIGSARFVPGGEDIVYSEAREGGPLQVWLTLSGSPVPRALGHADADVIAARSGELALLLRPRLAGMVRFVGTLAVAPLGGGAPREVTDEVEHADWRPGSAELAVVHSSGVGSPSRLEFPDGTVLYRSPGSIHHPRVSADGRWVAFLEDREGMGSAGRIVVVDRRGRPTELTGDWPSARGLAWSPHGDEIWFAAGEQGGLRALRSVDLRKRQRVVLAAPASLTLCDTAPDGRVLLTRDDERRVLVVMAPGEHVERDLSWLDNPGLEAISADGRTVLFGDRFGIYVRPTDGSAALRLGLNGGFADDLSPDGRWVLATSESQKQLVLIPVGAGAPVPLPSHGIDRYLGALLFPDARRVLFTGQKGDRPLRSYVQDVSGGPPRPLTPEGTWVLSISTDGGLAAATGPAGISVWPIAGGDPRPVKGSVRGERPVGWSADERWLWTFRRGEVPAMVYRVEIATGRRQLWRTLKPADAAGVYSIWEFRITPTGHAYAYTYRRVLSELYVVRGLK